MDRLTYVSPEETATPVANLLQRWTTQPMLGCLYYNDSPTTIGRSVTGTPAQYYFNGGTGAGAGGVFWDPNNMIDTVNHRIRFRESGLYLINGKFLHNRTSGAVAEGISLELIPTSGSISGFSPRYWETSQSNINSFTHIQYNLVFQVTDSPQRNSPRQFQTWEFWGGYSSGGNADLYIQQLVILQLSKSLPGKH